jgi:hypothetical protein
MVRPRTGNPVGRPFTYTTPEERPLTLSFRIPRDLADRLKGYASRHRQSITELILDGIRWRLEQGDPRYAAPYSEQYYDNTILQELATPVHLLDDRVPFDEDGPPAPPAMPAPPTPEISYDSNVVIQQLGVSDVEMSGQMDSPAPISDKAAIVARLQAMQAQGMSLQQMATQLTAEGIPTLKGLSVWQKGTIAKLLRTA